MAKIFYDHLIQIEEIHIELDKYHLSVEERSELIQIIDETTHHRVLDTILTHLPKEKHEIFLKKFHAAPHDNSLLDFLKEDVKDIEDKIKLEAKKLKSEILSEIKRSSSKSRGP